MGLDTTDDERDKKIDTVVVYVRTGVDHAMLFLYPVVRICIRDINHDIYIHLRHRRNVRKIMIINSKHLGSKIRQLRAERGMLQKNVAEKLGIARETYAKIEAGSNVTITTLIAVLGVFDCEIVIRSVREDRPRV